ncbi:MAG: 1-aminocyclopropane-1-carboxylate deaminase [Glaciecola sp.]
MFKLIKFDQPVIQALPFLLKTPKSSCNIVAPRIVDILRLDQIHPLISGNKWYKLKYNLEAAEKSGQRRLLSCGGPHSNHLHALACSGKLLGFSTIALVRGYSHLPLTETLMDCQRMGMELFFVDKQTYLKRYDPLWCQQQAECHDSYWIPEGGNNELGMKGCAEIAEQCLGYDEVWMSIGSGCTFTGIAQALAGIQSKAAQPRDEHLTANHSMPMQLKGVMAIKGGEALATSLLSKLNEKCSIDCDRHLGGFGRCPGELVDLIKQYDAQSLPLDPVYTAKLVMAFEQYWQEGKLDANKRYLLIHSGGLQGRRGVKALSAN